ncbi:hypothetical protein [Larkinella sp. C7]|jgi:YD repeat-containing protein|uniref:hypothetical protein n=1 Tax=Larkinella sp. C7 TaxID=2576607 RepID=UPI0011115658|nr:hypothetical protein [Larkinella sp. C7]
MKTVLSTLLLGFTLLSLTHCKKSEVDAPAEMRCKLTAIDRGNGNKHQYGYNAAGYVSQLTVNFKGPTGGSAEHVYVYTFAYNSANQITGATITVDGKTPDQLTDWGIGSGLKCRWTDGKLTAIEDLVGTQTILTTTIQYDAEGRILRFKGVPASKDEPTFEKVFSYDANGNSTYQYLEDGTKYYAEAHVYDSSTQSPESLLAKRGLPFDVFNLYPWKQTILKGFESDEFDESGKVTAHKTFQITNVVKNNHNYAVSQTVEEGNTKRVNTFGLADCD